MVSLDTFSAVLTKKERVHRLGNERDGGILSCLKIREVTPFTLAMMPDEESVGRQFKNKWQWSGITAMARMFQ
jgi:hypothetical protein